MAAPRYGVEHTIEITEEAIYGTPIADSGQTSGQLLVAPTDIFHGYKQIQPDRATGYNFATKEDSYNHNKGGMPTISINGWAAENSLDIMLYSFFQNVDEGAVTPFPKTYNIAQPAPDFAANAGLFFTLWYKNPTASKSEKLTSCVSQKLVLKASRDSDDGYLTYSNDLIAKAYVPDANPSNTVTKVGASHWNIFDLDRFAVEGVTLVPMSFEIELTKTIITIGVDGSGSWQNLGFPKYEGTLTIVAVDDANSRAAFNRVSTGNRNDINIGWGNATPGTDDGDLDFEINAQTHPDSKITRPEIEAVELKFNMVYDVVKTGAEDMIKVVLANGLDRTW